MVYKKFYNLLGIGDVRGRGVVLCTQKLILLMYLEKFMQVPGTMNVDVFPCMYTVRYW